MVAFSNFVYSQYCEQLVTQLIFNTCDRIIIADTFKIMQTVVISPEIECQSSHGTVFNNQKHLPLVTSRRNS